MKQIQSTVLGACLGLAVLAPAATQAQVQRSVTILPTIAEAGAPPKASAVVSAALPTRLVEQGWALVPPPSELDTNCFSDECETRVARMARAGIALRAKIFHSRPDSLSLFATTRSGAIYEASSSLPTGTEDELRAAVWNTLLKIEVQLKAGPGPFLSLKGTPNDATVLLDGRVLGKLPIERAVVSPGEHTLVVQREGFAASEQTFTASRFVGEVIDLPNVALAPQATVVPAEPSPTATLTRPEASSHAAAWWASGSALVAGGVALGTVGAVALARHNTNQSGDGNWLAPTDGVSPGKPAARALLGMGIALSALGAVGIGRGIFLARHVPTIEASATSVVAGLKGRF
jgi:hypothetical protein